MDVLEPSTLRAVMGCEPANAPLQLKCFNTEIPPKYCGGHDFTDTNPDTDTSIRAHPNQAYRILAPMSIYVLLLVSIPF